MPGDASTRPLRLLAEDADDLKVISAAVQDAVMQARDIVWTPARRRLMIELNRFRHEAAGAKDKAYERVRAGLAFEGVLGVRARGLPKPGSRDVTQLLSVHFEPGEPPGGVVRLVFAGDGEMRLEVEMLEVFLIDTETAWPTRRRPRHVGA